METSLIKEKPKLILGAIIAQIKNMIRDHSTEKSDKKKKKTKPKNKPKNPNPKILSSPQTASMHTEVNVYKVAMKKAYNLYITLNIKHIAKSKINKIRIF